MEYLRAKNIRMGHDPIRNHLRTTTVSKVAAQSSRYLHHVNSKYAYKTGHWGWLSIYDGDNNNNLSLFCTTLSVQLISSYTKSNTSLSTRTIQSYTLASRYSRSTSRTFRTTIGSTTHSETKTDYHGIYTTLTSIYSYSTSTTNYLLERFSNFTIGQTSAYAIRSETQYLYTYTTTMGFNNYTLTFTRTEDDSNILIQYANTNDIFTTSIDSKKSGYASGTVYGNLITEMSTQPRGNYIYPMGARESRYYTYITKSPSTGRVSFGLQNSGSGTYYFELLGITNYHSTSWYW